MAKTDNYTKNAGKPTAWDKVKDFINTGKQQQVKAIEKLPTYYADRINSNKASKFACTKKRRHKPPRSLFRFFDPFNYFMCKYGQKKQRNVDAKTNSENFLRCKKQKSGFGNP